MNKKTTITLFKIDMLQDNEYVLFYGHSLMSIAIQVLGLIALIKYLLF